MSDAASLHHQLFEAIQNRDLDRVRNLYHPESVFMGPDGSEHEGPDAAVAICRTYTTAFPDLSFDIRNQFTAGGDVSITELTARGTHKEDLPGIPATGQTVEVVACDVIEARDGKIYRRREYYDEFSFRQQLGVMDADTVT